ncbi:hypothetical protein IEC97_18495 [Neobacillus cucumis]|uniref:hypothetical protein n=1 Tax=Neobacillus cucumis TaxID=1740721 RepID=UPI0018E034BA|nr:hypothetical protein [Neobacillus cucumis]MBI0579366.1 hypothetical protein [Neobacillus cucumis]
MNILSSLIYTLFISVIELLYLVGAIIIVGLILGILEKFSNKFLIQTFGARGVLWTAWIGTPIHELGHLIMCFIWGHKVSRVKFLQFNSPDGVLGYVEHYYNRNSTYQQIGNFFIGLGPIFSGIGSLLLGMNLLLPQSFDTLKSEIHLHVSFETLDISVLKTVGVFNIAIIKSIFTPENLINPLFWIFLVLAVCISAHIGLSKADIQNSGKGLLMIFFVLVLFNIGARILQVDTLRIVSRIAEYNAYVLAFSSIAIFLSFLTFLLSFILYRIFIKIKRI